MWENALGILIYFVETSGIMSGKEMDNDTELHYDGGD